MTFKRRTHTCGRLRASDIGKKVTLNGWVDTRRDLGGVIFIDLRDRYGKSQVVFAPQHNPEVHERAKELRNEHVLSVTGKVERRPPGTENPNLATGEIDVLVDELSILNKADTVPFPPEDGIEASEELRLKYRYLDLRRPTMQRNLLLRHRTYQIVRRYFDENDFIEIETPFLMRSTPEGARDYLVPSRIHPGKFYALPQSPQTYKQILMVAGFDRYFQIVKCFRDEDLRADRQPEFTQIDVEMSFVDEDEVITISEGLMQNLLKQLKGVELSRPFPRLTYRQAMETYGTDTPDLRFDLRLTNVSELVSHSGFKIFSEVVANGGVVSGFAAPGCAAYTRNQLDLLVEYTKSLGAGGLVYAKVKSNGVESPIEKFVGKELLQNMREKMGAREGDLILVVSDKWETAYTILGKLRLEMAKRLKLLDENKHSFVWILEFPLFKYNPEEKRLAPVHHPFTAPVPEDIDLLDSSPTNVRARSYDLIMNGNEIAGGSIRIHQPELQSKVFGLLGISDEQAKKKFGFLMTGFRYGAPPHGGIAFGLDRIVMLLAGEKSIRDVIAFPKTSSAMSLMDDSPSEVDKQQLGELHIRII
ncbi:MAG: aspartate--tRNA ligase [Bacteroidota bacterium]